LFCNTQLALASGWAFLLRGKASLGCSSNCLQQTSAVILQLHAFTDLLAMHGHSFFCNYTTSATLAHFSSTCVLHLCVLSPPMPIPSCLCLVPQGERVRQIMAETQPAPIRIKLITQLQGTYLKPDQAKRLAEQLAPGAVKIIHKFVQVGDEQGLTCRLW
jgi:hypothetical protein